MLFFHRVQESISNLGSITLYISKQGIFFLTHTHTVIHTVIDKHLLCGTQLVKIHKNHLLDYTNVCLLKKTTLFWVILHHLYITARLAYNKATFAIVHNIITGCVPETIRSKFTLRNSRQLMRLNTPLPRIDLFKPSFINSGSRLWNSLPNLLRQTTSTHVFKSRYTSYLMKWK